MSILGKLLAVLCVLAAMAFMYLALIDLGKRQEWSYAVYRHDLAIDGLPIEEQEREAIGNVKLVDKQGSKTLQQLTQTAGGGPTLKSTQHAEVESVRDQARAEIDRLDGPEAKKKRLVDLLKPLKRTRGDREALDKLLSQPADDAVLAQLQGEFARTFDDALRPVYDAEGSKPKRDPGEKRQQIAHLLFNLGNAHLLFNLPSEEAWHQRVLVIVGLKEYANEANRQADALKEMTGSMRLALLEDQNSFAVQHQRLVKVIEVESEILQDRKATLASRQQVRKDYQELVAKRMEEYEKLTTELEKSRKDTYAALGKQALYEKTLFEAQRRFRDAAALNEEYERELRRLEKVAP